MSHTPERQMPTGLGVCYYPEHWDRSLWEEDLTRMKAAGIGTVRIAEFAWSLMETTDGDFSQIGWFDDFLDLCRAHQMQVIFGTPTATPPMWLQRTHPEILNTDRSGVPYDGPRRNYTYNSPVYRYYADRIVERIGEHYGPHPAIVGWQIDNELNCEVSEFYSEGDHDAFRTFLRAKLGSLEEVNRALGLTFWNRQYSDWSQVRLAGRGIHDAVNPHQLLWEKRFFSHSAVEFTRRQVEILRRHVPDHHVITTNGLFDNLDYDDLMDAGLDLITFDSYPNFAFDVDRDVSADRLRDRRWSWSLTRTRAISQPFGIMEQQSGAHGWTSRMMAPAPKPGQMRLWTMQSVAHGADYVSYFRWRTAPMGTEIYWHGLNDYSNEPGRKMTEVARVGREWEALKEIIGSRYAAEVAVVRSYDNTFDAELDRWHGRLDRASDDAIFTACQVSHTPLDFLFVSHRTRLEDLTAYDVLFAPHLAMMTPELADLLQRFVEAGGTLVMGARTGYKDEDGQCPMRPLPGLVGQWAGVHVTDFTNLGSLEEGQAVTWGEETISAPVFSEILEPLTDDVEVLATFNQDFYEGRPALTRRRLGQGTVYYLGACFSEAMVARLLREEGNLAPLSDLVTAPEGVELALRQHDGQRWLFILNYQREVQSVELAGAYRDLLSGETEQGTVELEPFGVRVYRLGD